MKTQKSTLGFWISPITKLLGIALLLINSFYWSIPEMAEYVASAYSGISPSHYTLTATNRFLGWLITTLQIAVLTYGLFTVANIFRDFSKGIWFATSFSNKLKRFGISLLIFSLLSPIVQVLTGFALTYTNTPETERMIILSFNIDGKGATIFLIGILLILMGKVITEATRLADENSQII